ncbi:hypothetical protein A2U01_0111233, partial [Trifolium medium]|nr:hypothetical protein [Trifolium medium]
DEQRAHDIVFEDSYQSVLQASSVAPQAPRLPAQPAGPPHAPQAHAPRPVAAPPDAVETLHVRYA